MFVVVSLSPCTQANRFLLLGGTHMTFETDFNELLLILSSLAIIFGLSRYVLHFASHRKGLAKASYSWQKLSVFVLVTGFILYLALNWWSHQSYPQSSHRGVVTNLSAFAGVLAFLFGLNVQNFVEKPIRILTWAIGIVLIIGLIWVGISFVVYSAYK